MENKYDPYCPVCSGCGEEGCCSPLMCEQSPEGDYCRGYLLDLKFAYILHKWLIENIELTAEQAERYDKVWEETYDKIYKDENI